MIKAKICTSCPNPHFDYYECNTCGFNFGFFVSEKLLSWSYCPVCGSLLYGDSFDGNKHEFLLKLSENWRNI